MCVQPNILVSPVLSPNTSREHTNPTLTVNVAPALEVLEAVSDAFAEVSVGVAEGSPRFVSRLEVDSTCPNASDAIVASSSSLSIMIVYMLVRL